MDQDVGQNGTLKRLEVFLGALGCDRDAGVQQNSAIWVMDELVTLGLFNTKILNPDGQMVKYV